MPPDTVQIGSLVISKSLLEITVTLVGIFFAVVTSDLVAGLITLWYQWVQSRRAKRAVLAALRHSVDLAMIIAKSNERLRSDPDQVALRFPTTPYDGVLSGGSHGLPDSAVEQITHYLVQVCRINSVIDLLQAGLAGPAQRHVASVVDPCRSKICEYSTEMSSILDSLRAELDKETV